jgi:hypothetical protein
MVIGSAFVINSVIARILHRGEGSFPVHFPSCLNRSNYLITFNGRLCGHHLVRDRGTRWIFGLQSKGSGPVCHGRHEDHPYSAFDTHKPAPKKNATRPKSYENRKALDRIAACDHDKHYNNNPYRTGSRLAVLGSFRKTLVGAAGIQIESIEKECL